MPRRATLVVSGSLLTLAGLVLPGGVAAAATDRTPPTLTVPTYATFVVGSQVSDTAYGADREAAYYPGSVFQQKVGWSATDAGSGICGYDVVKVYAGDDPVKVVSNSLATTYTFSATDYDDQEGGGSFKIDGYDIVARDCAGNTATAFVESRPVVTQEDGWTYGYAGVTLTYSGSWSSSSCACWSADRTRKTTAKGAAVKIRKNFPAGESLGLVMETAPTRGAFVVYVDGVRKATVDTYSATTQHRTIVWATRMPGGVHTIRLVNQATAGRSRIDLDAVLTGSERVGP